MSGTPNSGLTLDCVVAGADLTIEDLYIDAPVTDKNVINFTGIDNNLKMSGESLLENSNTSMYYAAIHVPSDGSLTIDGKGTLNLYKRASEPVSAATAVPKPVLVRLTATSPLPGVRSSPKAPRAVLPSALG